MNAIGGKAAKHLVARHAKQYQPEDPYYEFYTTSSGQQKRRIRAPPPGLTKAEAKLLKKIARRAHYLDKGIGSICGFRIGWTFLIGLIPVVGDLTDAGLNYYLVVRPAKEGAELPAWLVRQMLFNNAISAGVGLVPLVGDVILAAWKANSRNAKLLEEYLRVKGEEHIAAGLPGLTPGVARTDDAGGAAGTSHPAQVAAREHVAKQGAQSGTTAAPAAATASSTQPKKKWYQQLGAKASTNSASAAPATATTASGGGSTATAGTTLAPAPSATAANGTTKSTTSNKATA